MNIHLHKDRYMKHFRKLLKNNNNPLVVKNFKLNEFKESINKAYVSLSLSYSLASKYPAIISEMPKNSVYSLRMSSDQLRSEEMQSTKVDHNSLRVQYFKDQIVESIIFQRNGEKISEEESSAILNAVLSLILESVPEESSPDANSELESVSTEASVLSPVESAHLHSIRVSWLLLYTLTSL